MTYSSQTRALGVSTLGLLIYNPRALRVFGPGTMLVALGDAVMTRDGPLQEHMHHVIGVIGISLLSIASWFDTKLDPVDATDYRRL
eukprot:symbB.v1.2.006104.t1/scaffold364.1/size219240/1